MAEFSSVYSDSDIKLKLHLIMCVFACVFVFYKINRKPRRGKQDGETLWDVICIVCNEHTLVAYYCGDSDELE